MSIVHKDTANVHDIFISAADADYQRALPVINALRTYGLDVFVEVDPPSQAQDTSDTIDALNRSRLMVPYYSRYFPNQPRCQSALMQAFLAGHRSGNALRHIATINPDDPVSSHITPIEIADARYVVPKPDYATVVQAFERKLSGIPEPIGAAPIPTSPQWIGGSMPPVHSTERYAELWQVHNELEMGNYPLITDMSASGRIVAVLGASGTGKTDLAATYADLFGAQYQGGVYWTSLRNCEPTAVRDQYAHELQRVSILANISDESMPKDRLLGRIATHLATQHEPSLWIVDDIPEISDEQIDELIIPDARLHTILISHHSKLGGMVPYVTSRLQ